MTSEVSTRSSSGPALKEEENSNHPIRYVRLPVRECMYASKISSMQPTDKGPYTICRFLGDVGSAISGMFYYKSSKDEPEKKSPEKERGLVFQKFLANRAHESCRETLRVKVMSLDGEGIIKEKFTFQNLLCHWKFQENGIYSQWIATRVPENYTPHDILAEKQLLLERIEKFQEFETIPNQIVIEFPHNGTLRPIVLNEI